MMTFRQNNENPQIYSVNDWENEKAGEKGSGCGISHSVQVWIDWLHMPDTPQAHKAPCLLRMLTSLYMDLCVCVFLSTQVVNLFTQGDTKIKNKSRWTKFVLVKPGWSVSVWWVFDELIWFHFVKPRLFSITWIYQSMGSHGFQ